MYEANVHSRNNQAGLVKSILVNEIPLSMVFMILISSMMIEDKYIYMYGTFVPTHTGLVPIDFYQKKNYTLFNNKKIRKTATFAPRWK
jgi:hypothetical protein